MSINSQFFYFYIDELIKNTWVDWSENILSKVPEPEFVLKGGFQKISGSDNSSPRTRAGFCFRLGFINSKLISERKGSRSSIPKGWQSICDGEMVHTQLGYMAYTLGKGSRLNSKNRLISESINSICSILILLIGFSYNEKWYTTYSIFSFVLERIKIELKRNLNDEEVRLLSGAVFNTLDLGGASQLINAYTKNNSNFKLSYRFGKEGADGKLEFSPCEFEAIINDSSFNINKTTKSKACLFWGNSERGIFFRAKNSHGKRFLSLFAEEEQLRESKGLKSNLSVLLDSIANEDTSLDVISYISNLQFENKNISIEWINVMKSLKDGVLESLEYLKNEVNVPVVNNFFIHDQIVPDKASGNIELKVAKEHIQLIPEQGNILEFIDGQKFKIKNYSESEKEYIFVADRL